MFAKPVVSVARAARALTIIAIGALAACDSSAPAPSAHFKFDYSGAVSGAFSVAGAPSEATNAGATAFVDDSSQIGVVMGLKSTNGADAQIAVVAFHGSASGTVPVVVCDDPAPTCASMAFLKTTTATSELVSCGLASGSITITANTEKRKSGTFTGSGTCEDLDGNPLGAFTVTNGSFDAPVGESPFGDFIRASSHSPGPNRVRLR